MGCANNKFTADERESIFVWDLLCEAAPLTAEERRECRRRDLECLSERGEGGEKRKHHSKDDTEERRRKKREYAAAYRAKHKAELRRKDAEYRERNRDSINERQREYERAKRIANKTQNKTSVSAV